MLLLSVSLVKSADFLWLLVGEMSKQISSIHGAAFLISSQKYYK